MRVRFERNRGTKLTSNWWSARQRARRILAWRRSAPTAGLGPFGRKEPRRAGRRWGSSQVPSGAIGSTISCWTKPCWIPLQAAVCRL